MNNVLLCATDGTLKATLVNSSHRRFFFERSIYLLKDFDLGDVDYLRNPKHELVGFAYIIGNEVEQEIIPLIERQSEAIYLKRDSFLFLFRQVMSLKSKRIKELAAISITIVVKE